MMMRIDRTLDGHIFITFGNNINKVNREVAHVFFRLELEKIKGGV